MDERDWLADRFEEHRSALRAVAYRMLGSLGESDDAVQEAWFRLSRTDVSGVENLNRWLTTVVARVCLDMLRSRQARREDSFSPQHLPDPIVSREDRSHPEYEALLADSVSLALLVVLDTLSPPERLAFVLHDMFDLPFDDIAPLVGRTPTAARQLASRARRRVKGAAPASDGDVSRQRQVVDAFFAAARGGDLHALVAVLDPDVVVRTDVGAAAAVSRVHGAEAVAQHAVGRAQYALKYGQPALVNGAAGLVASHDGMPFAVMAFTIRNDKITEIDILADPDRLRNLDIAFLSDDTAEDRGD